MMSKGMFGIELVAFLAFDCYCMWDFHLPLFLDMNDYQGHNILLNSSPPETKGNTRFQILCCVT